MLQLHAKTYYDNPLVTGGDEHYIDIPDVGSDQETNVGYSGTGWELIRGTVFNQSTPLGGYLNVFVQLGNSTHLGMHADILTLSCSLGYWGSPPRSGFGTVDWTALLTNSDYKVIRVTN